MRTGEKAILTQEHQHHHCEIYTFKEEADTHLCRTIDQSPLSAKSGIGSKSLVIVSRFGEAVGPNSLVHFMSELILEREF